MGTGLIKLGGVAVREGFEQLTKRLGKESDLAGELIGSFDSITKQVLSKEIDAYPPSAETLKDIIRNHPEDLSPWIKELRGVDANKQLSNNVQEIVNKANKPEVAAKAAEPAKAYNLSEGVEDFMGDTDLTTARAWENPGGELDKALEDMLTVKKKTTITTPEGKKVTLNKGDKLTPDMLTGSKKDYYNSLIATGFKTSPDDELVYGFGGQELSKMAGLEGKDPGFSPQLHKGKSFHHKSMKEIQSSIHKRARQLRESGEATTDDLINLHALSNSMGAPSGSRKSAGMWLEEFGHNITHKQTAQRKGIEPTTTRWTNNPLKKGKSGRPSKPPEFSKELFNEAVNASDELGVDLTRFDLQYIKSWSDVAEGQQGPINLKRGIAKWKVFRKTNAYKRFGPDGESEMSRLMKSTENMNIAELTQFQKEILEDVTKPMTEEMVLMEEVMDSLTPRELIQLMQKKDWNTPLNLKKALEEKQSALAGAKKDKALRKQMNTAFN